MFVRIATDLQGAGADFIAEAIVFGCTEFGLLIDPQQINLPVYDTAEIHIRATVEMSLNKQT